MLPYPPQQTHPAVLGLKGGTLILHETKHPFADFWKPLCSTWVPAPQAFDFPQMETEMIKFRQLEIKTLVQLFWVVVEPLPCTSSW